MVDSVCSYLRINFRKSYFRRWHISKIWKLEDRAFLRSSWLAPLMQRNKLVGSLFWFWLKNLRVEIYLGLGVLHQIIFGVLEFRKINWNKAFCIWLWIHLLSRVRLREIGKQCNFQILVAFRGSNASSGASSVVLLSLITSVSWVVVAPVSVVSLAIAPFDKSLTRISEFVSFLF